MRILVLDEELPWPLNTGKRLRCYNLQSRLAKNHELRYVGYGTEGSQAWQEIKAGNMMPVAIAPRIPRKKGIMFYFRLLRNLFSRDPYIVQALGSDIYASEVEKQVEEFRPDIIISESIFCAHFFRSEWGCRKIAATHNVESDIWQRYIDTEKNPFKRWYIRIQWRKVNRFEREAMHRVDGAIAVSGRDAAQLSEMNPRVPVTVIDNGVDLDFFSPVPGKSPGDETMLVFVGSMDWRPNQDAVMFFASEILPLLRHRLPGITVSIVGRNPPPEIERLDGKNGIHVTGTVDDVRTYYQQAAASIVPLRVGGGSRLKILESLSIECPVISTTIGAEGLNVVDGETVLLADTAEEFADCVVRLVNDRALAQHLAENGRKLAESEYGWDALARRMERFLVQLVSQSDS